MNATIVYGFCLTVWVCLALWQAWGRPGDQGDSTGLVGGGVLAHRP
jgi:hypothetical protein